MTIRALGLGASRRWMLIVSALFAALLPVSHIQAQVDYNRDGFITFEDFDAFVGAFEAGC